MNRRTLWKLVQFLMVIAAIPLGVKQVNAGPGGGTYYANSPAGGLTGTALRKFVDSLPGLGAANANNLGQYIPVATADTATFPGSDYYQIGLVQYTEKMHSDLPKATLLRGYRDLGGNQPAHYLGPMIIAKTYDPTKPAGVNGNGKPVRVKFRNLLPTGAAGNLFIPVDTTMMGTGRGPVVTTPAQFGGAVPAFTNYSGNYTQNRAAVHLHGGNTPWISDGTPHQWTVPVGEVSTPYQKGASAKDVPDMPASGQGELTYYFTNQQSNRLMFYHDHTLGMTRLNVYAGEAAGYLITDQVEEDLISGTNVSGANPGLQKILPDLGGVYHNGIPLIIQDKTFVPQNIDVQDAAWNFKLTNTAVGPTNLPTTTPRDKIAQPWGAYGDLWFPHVYEPNQYPLSPAGANPFGRWDYGPWFWPPVNISPANAVIPDPSTTPEAFMDTPIVNGTAYPFLQVAPKPYRFRILNASNDRVLNLQLYYVDPNDPSGKEVKMVPAGPNPLFPIDWPTDGRAGGVPDPALRGPNMIQIGTEGGFLPNPVVVPNRPVGFDYNRRNIVVLNTLYRALMLGPAERADVIIDFSSVPTGSKIILYNDAPAPNPAFDTRYDYFTAAPDQTTSGGAPSTLVGYGPNTRTVMQFQVSGAAGAPFNLPALQAALPVAFKASQPSFVVPESAYNNVYGTTSPDLYSKIQDYSFTITPIGATIPTTIPFQPKAIQELWDPYGRMNATLGVELPFTTNLTQTTVPMGFAEPATEFLNDGQPQIWKITHNGVDTHPVHFHLFNVQLINRVGWDGAIRPPDDNELGWKETVRMNPLEDAIVAFKPVAQTLPFPLPFSTRPIDPSQPANAAISTTTTGNLVANSIYSFANNGTSTTATATTVSNTPGGNSAGYNYGFEYVWHCHILGHEENDFMRPMIFKVPDAVPAAPTLLAANIGAPATANTVINQVVLNWTDTTNNNSASYRIERADVTGGTIGTYAPLIITSFLPTTAYNALTWTDTAVTSGSTYAYRIFAFNSKGDSTANVAANVTTPAWTKATGVTLTPNAPTPHVQGTGVIFTAGGSGATAAAGTTVAYQYRFWLTSGVTKTLVQDWGRSYQWSLPDTTLVGSYTITVDVRTGNSATPDASTTVPYNIVLPPAPIVLASPIPGIYAAAPVVVTLTSNVPANIFYTTDGTTPTSLSTKYLAPISLTTSTILTYFAIDANGSASAPQSGNWIVHVSDMVASVKINNGATATKNTAVTLTLSATDPVGVTKMQFSNDNITYTAEEPYATTKAWTIPVGDGPKTVYVRFRDGSIPAGTLYPPVTATITLDTVAPITTAAPIAGTYATGPVPVTLTTNEPATIYYTVDGTIPTTASSTYIAPIQVNSSVTIKYFAVDTAGNPEAVKTGTWTIHTSDMASSILINNGASGTTTPNVTLTLSATDPQGVATMQFSNDGVAYSAEEVYATTKAWTLSPGDGNKVVYVRFRDKSLGGGVLYPPISASIVLVTGTPITTASPIPGTYSTPPLLVSLSSPGASAIYYTVNGTTPTTASTQYSTPIQLVATTTIKYFAVNIAGNVEPVHTATWTFAPLDLTASVKINNGATLTNNNAVTLTLSAVDPLGVSTMQFSNDGVNYTAEEAYSTSKAWTLSGGDGTKTVYVRFRDNALPSGTLYAPVTASITLDTTPPVTMSAPIAGTYSAAPVLVTLTSNEPSTIYYTVDGSTPTTTSPKYTAPIIVSATTTIKYFGVDTAGNTEIPKTGTWSIATLDMTASVKINNGAALTNKTAVTLNLLATDPVGVSTMQFSNDGVNYTAEEPYATSKAWTLAAGDGTKTVYVKFRDATLGGGMLYAPVTTSITLDTTPPVTTAAPIAGTYSTVPVSVALSANEPAVIYYTTDGTAPTTVSLKYSAPISVATTTTIKYFGVDTAGNAETPNSGTWTVHTADMVASVSINNGGARTNNTSVTLALNAVDPAGVATMQFSNDGINYSAEEPYATTKTWTLMAGDGIKTVYARFRDKTLPTGNLYAPVTSSIVLDTVPPVTTAGPIAGTYSAVPVSVTMNTNKTAKIYYTTDGSTPTTASNVYTAPISVAATTTIKYFAVDLAGNSEAVKTGTWTVHTLDMVASIKINNGDSVTRNANVTLTLSATDPAGVATMQFSNDGVSYTAEEPYATSKTWTLSAGDGAKTVYVRFRDKSIPTGTLYDPVTATITLGTVPPVTTAAPIPGTYSTAPVSVILSANKPATVYYTTDGSVPTTASPVYSKPLSLAATSTVKYFAVDSAGNVEAVKSGIWTIHTSDMVASVKINNGASTTKTLSVALTLSAVDPMGVATMQFSNDGVSYSVEEPYTTGKAWTLSPGDGNKTVYVRFRDKSLPTGNLYDPVTAAITLNMVPGPDGRITGGAAVSIADALRALQIAAGLVTPTAQDLAHGDVAPIVNGVSKPDGVIDILDALVILRATLGLIVLQ